MVALAGLPGPASGTRGPAPVFNRVSGIRVYWHRVRVFWPYYEEHIKHIWPKWSILVSKVAKSGQFWCPKWLKWPITGSILSTFG